MPLERSAQTVCADVGNEQVHRCHASFDAQSLTIIHEAGSSTFVLLESANACSAQHLISSLKFVAVATSVHAKPEALMHRLRSPAC